MKRLVYPLVVEGKYDRERILKCFDGNIITTGGFGIFSRPELRSLLRRLSDVSPVLVLTDSDSAGNLIRNFIRSVIPGDKLINLYLPAVPGKEKRKAKPSAEGFLGVEGFDADALGRVLSPYTTDAPPAQESARIDKARLYADGLSGRDNSAKLRLSLLSALGLPPSLSANALIEAVNMLGLEPEYTRFCAGIRQEEKND